MEKFILCLLLIIVSTLPLIIQTYKEMSNKTKTKLMIGIAVLVVVLIGTISSIHKVEPNADEEAVLIYKPILFGHGGVDKTPVRTGLTWCVFSTYSETFKITPIRYEVAFDDIMSNDNTPLDYATSLILQIQQGKSPILMQNYGKDWFKNNVEAVYCNFVREEVSKYSPFDLMSNREVCNKMDHDLQSKMEKYFMSLSKQKEFPVVCKQVVTGRAKPNPKQLEEMNSTAAAIQAKQTQDRKAEMQVAREKAEKQRAIADKAYMNAMNLTPSQFIQLKAWDVIANKQGANIDVLVSPSADPMWNIRR